MDTKDTNLTWLNEDKGLIQGYAMTWQGTKFDEYPPLCKETSIDYHVALPIMWCHEIGILGELLTLDKDRIGAWATIKLFREHALYPFVKIYIDAAFLGLSGYYPRVESNGMFITKVSLREISLTKCAQCPVSANTLYLRRKGAARVLAQNGFDPSCPPTPKAKEANPALKCCEWNPVSPRGALPIPDVEEIEAEKAKLGGIKP